MKKKYLVFIMSVLTISIMLTACGKKSTVISINSGKDDSISEETTQSSESGSDEENIASVSSDVSETSVSDAVDDKEVTESLDYEAMYKDVLENTLVYINEADWDEIDDGEIGILEIVNYTDNPYDAIGYIIEDYSGDGIPELLILLMDPVSENIGGREILAAYTLVDGKPKFVFEGYNRNAMMYMGDGRFLSEGSAGAMYSLFGIYTLSKDGSSLDCKDFYFTYEHDETFETIDYYHNTNGEFDTTVSEVMDIDDAGFTDMISGFLAEVKPFDKAISFASYLKNTDRANIAQMAKLKVYYYEDMQYLYSKYDAHTVDAGMYETEVLIAFSKEVTDFSFFNVNITDYTSDSKPVFDSTECYSVKSVAPECPEKITLVFRGDSPSYGFSYVDGDGVKKTYLLDVSGVDGSLITIAVD